MMARTRIAWGITGAGDYVRESLDVMSELEQDPEHSVTVLLSKSGELVVKWYGLWDRLKAEFSHVHSERGANTPFLAGPLQLGHYALLFISPGSANTVAKIACGIADSLITNCVAQTIKGGTPVYIYPVDQLLGSQETEGPQGERITISTRQVDIDNVEKVRRMAGIHVLSDPTEIQGVLRAAVSQIRR